MTLKRDAFSPSAAGPDGTPPSWSIAGIDWIRRGHGRPASVDASDRGNAVLLLPAPAAAAARLRAAFCRAGYRTVWAGAAGASEDTTRMPATLDPTDERDWDALLGRAGEMVAVVGYGTLFGGPAAVDETSLRTQLDTGLYGLLACARAVARAQRRQGRPLTLAVVASHAVDVTGAERVNSATAMLDGVLRTVELEHPGVRCVLVDAAPDVPEDVLGAQCCRLADPMVALRGSSVWLPVLRPVSAAGSPGNPRLRHRGVYLLTGGLGELGLKLAQGLAETGLRPRIALVGRSAPPAISTLRGMRVAAALAGMADAGAEVITLQGDVADPLSLEYVINQVENTFGVVHGVVHGAGQPAVSTLDELSRKQVEVVLAPKVSGVLALERVFHTRPALDFLVLLSSRAALAGRFGGANHAAANAFLNAHAQQRGGGDRWTLSIAWPVWSEVGAAVNSAIDVPAPLSPAQDPPGPLEYRCTLSEHDDWRLDEYRIAGRPAVAEVVLVELVLDAAAACTLFAKPAGVELRDLTFLSPVDCAGPVELGVLFALTDGGYRFRVRSRPADSGGSAWAYHASGVIAIADADERGEAIDLTGLPPAGRVEVRPGNPGGLLLGPHWNCAVTAIAGLGGGTYAISLPAACRADLAEHRLHPGLVNRALAVPDVRGENGAGLLLPFLCGRIRVYAPLPAVIIARVKWTEADDGTHTVDADVHSAETGDLLVEVRSFGHRRVAARTSGRPPRAGRASLPARSEPDPSTVAHPHGISPADGVSAFFALLSGSYPPVVLVSAPGETLTIPGIPLVGDEATAVGGSTADFGRPPPVDPGTVDPPPSHPARTGFRTPGGDGLTGVLETLWTETLGIPKISPDDDFFDLGGNSLLAVQLTARLRERFAVDLDIGVLFDASTIRQLVAELTRLGVR